MTIGRTGWAAYWDNEPAAETGATLGNLPPVLRDLLDAPWTFFAATLPTKARVLDLATGGGMVLDLLRRQRADLMLTGVDAAPRLPERRGMVLRGGITTARLPFPDASFDAVTSRFGIEYGPLEAGACEAARVIRPGGRIGLILHHPDSNVLRHNRARSEALHWAAHESGWIDRAIKLARTRVAIPLPVPPAFRAAPADAAARFPDQSAAWEFLTGLVQILEAVPLAESEAAIKRLAAKADAELARLAELFDAACPAGRITKLMHALANAGVHTEPDRTIDEPGGVPLAWWVEGRKAA